MCCSQALGNSTYQNEYLAAHISWYLRKGCHQQCNTDNLYTNHSNNISKFQTFCQKYHREKVIHTWEQRSHKAVSSPSLFNTVMCTPKERKTYVEKKKKRKENAHSQVMTEEIKILRTVWSLTNYSCRIQKKKKDCNHKTNKSTSSYLSNSNSDFGMQLIKAYNRQLHPVRMLQTMCKS